MERDTAIELGTRVVENLANSLLSWGQSAGIERDDLISVGMIEAIRTVDRDLGAALNTHFPLDKRIARNAKTMMLRHIQREKREARYRQHGSLKAIKDTDAGTRAGDVDGGSSEEGDAAPALIPLSVKNHDFPNTDEFVYCGWLCGSIRMGRDRYGYYFPEVEDPKCERPLDAAMLNVRPVLECLVQLVWTDDLNNAEWIALSPRDAWGYLIDPDEERERQRAAAETVRKCRESVKPYEGLGVSYNVRSPQYYAWPERFPVY